MNFLYKFLIIVLVPASLFSQKIDSLKNLLAGSEASERVEILLNIGEEYLTSDPDQSLSAADEAITISKKLNQVKLLGKSIQLRGKSLFRKNQFLSAKNNLLSALKTFQTIQDTASIASVYDNLGDVYDRSGDKDSALICFNIVQKFARIIGDKNLESLSYSSMGLIYWRMGQNKTSLEHHFKALELRRQINFTRGIAMTLNNIGVVYWRLGNYLKALEYYTESLNIRKKINDQRGTITATNNVGLIYLKLNNFKTARGLFDKCLIEAESIGYTFGIAYSNHCIAQLLLETGEYDSAITYAQKAIDGYYSIAELNSVALSMNFLGKAHTGLGNYESALNYFDAALDTAKRINDKFSYSHILQSKAKLYLKQNHLNRAIDYLKESLKIANEEKFADLMVENNLLFSEILKKQNKPAEALKYFEDYVNLRDDLRLEQLSTDISDWQLKQKEFENEILRRDNSLKAAQVEKEKVYRNWLIIFSAISILLVVGFFRSYFYKRKTAKQILEQKEELERLNKMLSEKNFGLEENNRAKDRLFSVIAHDLKTPFQALIGYSEMMAADVDELTREETIQYSNSINNSAKSLLNLTQNLLNWSRIQFHKFSVFKKEIVISELIENVIKFQKDFAESKNLEFKLNFKNSLTVNSDEDMLQTILRNLISNAIKFSYPGGVIEIEGCKNHKDVTIKVKDTGVGIPAERLDYIFSMDNIQTTNGTKNEKGTGLGLYISKEFASILGGDIKIESEVGKGTSFHIILPQEIQ